MGNCKCKDEVHLNQEITTNKDNIQVKKENFPKKLTTMQPRRSQNYFRKYTHTKSILANNSLNIINFNSSGSNTETAEDNYPSKFITIFGPKKAGKTSLLDRLCENKFIEEYEPSRDDEKSLIDITLGGKKYHLFLFVKQFSFYDDNFENFDKNKCNIIFVMFDLSDKKSFFQAMKMIRTLFSKHTKPLFLVGNKNEIKKENIEMNNIITKYNLKYFEISLKNNEGVYSLMKGVSNVFENNT